MNTNVNVEVATKEKVADVTKSTSNTSSKSNLPFNQLDRETKERFLIKRVSHGHFDFNLLLNLNYQQKVAIAWKMMREIGLPFMVSDTEIASIATNNFQEDVFRKVVFNQIAQVERNIQNFQREKDVSNVSSDIVSEFLNQEIKSEEVHTF
jgi:hypothetical protein